MRGRIKIGAGIYQDFSFGRWPNCSPPKEAKDPHRADDPDMIFEMEWNGHGWWCTAPGYGDKEWYGNGRILVFDGGD